MNEHTPQAPTDRSAEPPHDDASDESVDRTAASDPRDPQEVAEETSHIVQPDDPMHEPPNSTVDDWFGQRVQADADRLDEALAEGGGAGDASGSTATESDS